LLFFFYQSVKFLLRERKGDMYKEDRIFESVLDMVIKQSGEKRHVYPVTLCMERSSISKIAISGAYGGEDGGKCLRLT